MNKINVKTTIALALMGLLFSAAAARADFGYPEVAPQDKIDLCDWPARELRRGCVRPP